jgi:DnaK suppressor protein
MDTLESDARQALMKRRSSLRGQLEQEAAVEEHVARVHLAEQQARSELQHIDEALARMEEGSFGRCSRCGGAIGRHRLRAVPEARYCLVCSELAGR